MPSIGITCAIMLLLLFKAFSFNKSTSSGTREGSFRDLVSTLVGHLAWELVSTSVNIQENIHGVANFSDSHLPICSLSNEYLKSKYFQKI